MPSNGFYRGVLWTLPLALLVWAVILLVVLVVSSRAEPTCRDNPLSIYGADASRYQIVDPCVTVSGQIMMLADETEAQGGERHVYLWAEVGNKDGWTDTEFVELEWLPPMADLLRLKTATITGALVWDKTNQRYAIKPAWWLGEVSRAYPERRSDGSVWRVWQWRDGGYSEERIK